MPVDDERRRGQRLGVAGLSALHRLSDARFPLLRGEGGGSRVVHLVFRARTRPSTTPSGAGGVNRAPGLLHTIFSSKVRKANIVTIRHTKRILYQKT